MKPEGFELSLIIAFLGHFWHAFKITATKLPLIEIPVFLKAPCWKRLDL